MTADYPGVVRGILINKSGLQLACVSKSRGQRGRDGAINKAARGGEPRG
jgi:hypothetical protein